MIPLRDLNPRHGTPLVTILLIAANAAAFFYQVSLGPQAGQQLVYTFGMVPARFEWALAQPDVNLAAAVVPFFTSMFLHGGWLHLIGNMWFLWVFGDNIEDRMGHLRYLVFYILCGLGAGAAHLVFNLNSTLPAVGASGAVSGVLGAYLVLFPHARIITLVPLVFVFFTARLPAVLLLGYWFLLQFLGGMAGLAQPRGGGGVAWWAHIGGFIFGVILVQAFVRRPRRPQYVV
jgi:membrane associated rhomboid family serine protease